ncbi:Uncharacterised protein [Vibrio cholerae]|nr:Uncharacterised protein [Vibrio cholerae]
MVNDLCHIHTTMTDKTARKTLQIKLNEGRDFRLRQHDVIRCDTDLPGIGGFTQHDVIHATREIRIVSNDHWRFAPQL